MELSTRDGYALWSESYDEGTNALIVVEELAVAEVLATLPPIGDALDLGVGTGRHALTLARRGARVLGLDPSREMLAVARRKAEQDGLTIDLVEGAIEEGLPFDGRTFDLVVSALVLCHVPDLREAAGELARAIRPGGYLLITDFHPDMLDIGLRTSFIQNEQKYQIANAPHSRAAYLDAVRQAGLESVRVEDIPLKAGAEYLRKDGVAEKLLADYGDKGFCLVILAQRPAT